MGPATLGTAAGTAVLTVGRGLLGAAAGGLSFVAELARSAAGGDVQGAEAAAPAESSLGERIAALQERIKQQLAQAGIRLRTPVDLASNGFGGIAVVGPHPERAAIEEALASDILLERDFHEIATQTPDFRVTVRP